MIHSYVQNILKMRLKRHALVRFILLTFIIISAPTLTILTGLSVPFQYIYKYKCIFLHTLYFCISLPFLHNLMYLHLFSLTLLFLFRNISWRVSDYMFLPFQVAWYATVNILWGLFAVPLFVYDNNLTNLISFMCGGALEGFSL